MKTVIVASNNPVKIEVARLAFAAVFPDETFEVSGVQSQSGVPDQPMEDETRQGALNRLAFVKKMHPDADYWSAQEGGLFRDGEHLAERAWIAMGDKEGTITEASTASFHIPIELGKLVLSGLELGDASDKFFSASNSKHGIGAIGYITDGVINRTQYYLPAAIIAVSQLKHKEWYSATP